MSDAAIRLGGMALPNGVLVHGPTSWACAVRLDDGTVKVAAAAKRLRGDGVTRPFLRGPARLLEALAVLPELRRALPEARLPFDRPAVIAAMVAGAVTLRAVRRSGNLGPLAEELVAGLVAAAPALVALRGGELAGYHGAEHATIGAYETGAPHGPEHDRCGSHLAGPMLGASALFGAVAARAPHALREPARAVASVAAVGVATEIFAWMLRNPERPLARALARPGSELQRRIGTREPTPGQLEVAEAALAACLVLERGGQPLLSRSPLRLAAARDGDDAAGSGDN